MIAFCRHGALWALLTALCLPAALRADIYSALAFDNGTIQPDGPRPFTNGKRFMNIEGVNNNRFASFAVADVDATKLADANGNTFPSAPTGLNSLTITLTQANASFTNVGTLSPNLKFYIAEDAVTSIQNTDAAVLFDKTDSEGLGTQLAPVHLLGLGTFAGTSNPDTSGTVDTFAFPTDPATPLDSATVTYVLSVLANGGKLRLVVVPTDPDVAATYTGCIMFDASNTPSPNPAGATLTVDVRFN